MGKSQKSKLEFYILKSESPSCTENALQLTLMLLLASTRKKK